MPFHERRVRHDKKKRTPETADEFLDEGIFQEEGGDRWRPGDKPKAGRFYQRAIENYTAALVQNPRLYDAIYNKARLLYYLSQNSEFLPAEHQSKDATNALLAMALQSHRDCLLLDSENEDALFNTAQVLCSLSEVLLEYRTAEARPEAIRHLDEAILLFAKCLAQQEAQYASFESQREDGGGSSVPESDMGIGKEDDSKTGGVSLADGSSDSGGDDVDHIMDADTPPGPRAVIQTPVTPAQILDTTLASLAAYTSLLPLLTSDPSAFSAAQRSAESLLSEKIQPLSAMITDSDLEVRLCTAAYQCAFAEALFRGGTHDLAAWQQALKAVYDASWAWNGSARALCDKSEAHNGIAAAAVESGAPAVAWKHYAHAAACLSAAAKLEPGRAEIHLARGDTEMVRSRLDTVDVAVKSRELLMRNAGVFWRGAKKLGNEKVVLEADVKEALLAAEIGDDMLLRRLAGRWKVVDVVKEACDEGVFGPEWVDRIAQWAAAKNTYK